MRSTTFVAPLALLALGVVGMGGCSGTSSVPIDGGGDGSYGDGGCIAPTEGASCSPNDIACQPPGNICCVGYSWMCQNGAWFKAGVGCACQTAMFPCGPSAQCTSDTQFCLDQAPGIAFADGGVPPDSYACTSLPAECAGTPTCACVTAHNACPTAVASCDDTNGTVTVHCMGQ